MTTDSKDLDISGIDKAELLRALYNNSKPLGMGVMHHTPEGMSASDAAAYVEKAKCTDARGKESIYFDYLKGRVMKVELAGDTMYTGLYNRDVGPGAAEAVVAKIRESMQ